jgi:hypothetical protein
MRKYLPGGRCGGNETQKKEDTQGVNSSFNNLLAQRDAQIAQMWAPQTTPLTQTQTQIVLAQPKEEKKLPSKEQLIHTILDGDY